MQNKLYFSVVLILIAVQSHAQIGTLDTTFSVDGMTILTPSTNHQNAEAILIQPDSTVLFTGVSITQPLTRFDIIVGKMLPDGSLDNTFGDSGYVVLDYNGFSDFGYDIDLTDEGKILVTGAVSNTAAKVDMFVMRLMPNGTYDTTFGDTGKVVITVNSDQDYANEAVILPDGKIVLGGYSKYLGNNLAALVRLNDNGTLDTTFGTGGISLPNIPTQSEQIIGLELKPDGSFIAAGYHLLPFVQEAQIWGITEDGYLDTSFGANGTITVLGMDVANNVVGANNQYYISGYSTGNPPLGYIVNCDSSGNLNSAFGASGIVRDTVGVGVEYNDLTLQQDGKIVAVGGVSSAQFVNDLLVTRFNTDGSLDSTFGTNGHVSIDLLNQNNENMLGVAIQDDGKIVACGVIMTNNNDMVLIRLNGSPMTTSAGEINRNESSFVIYPNPSDGHFIISIPYPVKNQTVTVLNALGQIIFTKRVSDDLHQEINLTNITSGVYFVELKGDEGKSVKKILID